MSETKFTPGPWVARQGEDTNWWFVIEDSEGNEIGSGDGGFEEPEAQLMAAAPELYSLLDEAVNTIDRVSYHEDVALGQEWVDEAKAALSKARGQA